MAMKRSIALVLCVASGVSLAGVRGGLGQEETARRGRKYKAPPVVSHVEVTVVRATNGKPIPNAAVVFHPIKDGKDEGNLEVKTDPEGKAIIDVIPTGSDVRVQVIASGYATFGQDYHVDGPSKEIGVSLVRPRAQVSAYTENKDEPSQRKSGVQEPIRPKSTTSGPPATGTPPQP